MDLGFTNIGFSAKTDKLEVISGTLTLRKDVSNQLAARRRYRRARRSRLGYRLPRFNNRVRPEGWLAPSTQHRHDSHIRLVEKLETLLPITQQMQHPELTGVAYQ
jgi:hypothetical protein